MDWARTKSILIIVFLILNIFLMINLGITRLGSGPTRDAIINTVKILKNKGVTLTCEVPANSNDTYKLKYENNSLDRKKIATELLGDNNISADFSEENLQIEITSKAIKFNGFNSFSFNDAKPSGSINLSKKSEVEKLSKKLLQRLKIKFYEFYTDVYKANEDGTVSIIIRDRYKNSIFFDNYAAFVVSKDGVKSIDCRFRNIKGFSNKKIAIVPAHEILLKNFNVKRDMEIVAIDLGWHIGDKNESETKEAYSLSAWRILTQRGESYYFNANNGEKIN